MPGEAFLFTSQKGHTLSLKLQSHLPEAPSSLLEFLSSKAWRRFVLRLPVLNRVLSISLRLRLLSLPSYQLIFTDPAFGDSLTDLPKQLCILNWRLEAPDNLL